MKNGWLETLKSYYSKLNELHVEGDMEALVSYYPNQEDKNREKARLMRSRELFSLRNARPLKSKTTIRNLQIINEEEREVELTLERVYWNLYQINRQFMEQEEEQTRRITLRKFNGHWLIASDRAIEKEGSANEERLRAPASEPDASSAGSTIRARERHSERFYDRAKAKRYAELWWDRYNPEYPKFDVDCTNFVSQCLRAGGLPLDASGDRAKGWWHEGDSNWSFSWSVSHSLRLYFMNPKTVNGSRAEVKKNPEELMIGDFICYDWDGDGRYEHATFVVAKDPHGMPLVNAHTVNSRHRYWEYRDSYAWTKNTKYTFIHIKG